MLRPVGELKEVRTQREFKQTLGDKSSYMITLKKIVLRRFKEYSLYLANELSNMADWLSDKIRLVRERDSCRAL